MNKEEILGKLKEIIKDFFDDDKLDISLDTVPSDIPDWDSLAHISLLEAIQEDFNIELSLEEIVEIKNVSDIVEMIGEKNN